MAVELSEEERQALSDLRKRFQSEYEASASWVGKIAQSDVVRLKSQDWWPVMFLQRYDLDVDIAFPVFIECLKWRNEFQVDHISILSLKSYLERQHIFVHSCDKQNQSILWFNTRHHKKGDENTPKLVVYWLERHVMETRGKPLVIIFDMTGSGLQNMDFDLVKFLLHCLKFYYPGVLAYLLVFDIPFILNAAWKLIRSWLDPAAQKMIVFVGKSTITQHIDASHLPRHMGGTDEFVFTLDELARCIGDGSPAPPSISERASSPSSSGYDLVDDMINIPVTSDADLPRAVDSEDDPFPKRRSVKFVGDEEESVSVRSGPLTLPPPGQSTTERRSNAMVASANGALPAGQGSDGDDRSLRRRGSQQSLPKRVREIVDNRMNDDASTWFNGPFLAISPKEELILRTLPGETDRVEVVVVRNTGAKNVIFKIKTTSPEKFRVRPSSGIIPSGDTTVIRLYLQPGYQETIGREKFLVMALETDEATADNFGALWKDATEKNKGHFEHRLRCRVGDLLVTNGTPIANGSARKELVAPPLSNQMDELVEQMRSVRNENRILLLLLVLVLVMVSAMLLYQRSVSHSLANLYEEAISSRIAQHNVSTSHAEL